MEDLKDKLARALADMENLRDRTARASEQSRTFAIQVGTHASLSMASMHAQHFFLGNSCPCARRRGLGTLRPAQSIADQLHAACPKILCSVQKFVTGLLDAVDDLERALESVPADAEQQKKDPTNLLHGLRDGIVLTQKSLEKVREQVMI